MKRKEAVPRGRETRHSRETEPVAAACADACGFVTPGNLFPPRAVSCDFLPEFPLCVAASLRYSLPVCVFSASLGGSFSLFRLLFFPRHTPAFSVFSPVFWPFSRSSSPIIPPRLPDGGCTSVQYRAGVDMNTSVQTHPRIPHFWLRFFAISSPFGLFFPRVSLNFPQNGRLTCQIVDENRFRWQNQAYEVWEITPWNARQRTGIRLF